MEQMIELRAVAAGDRRRARRRATCRRPRPRAPSWCSTTSASGTPPARSGLQRRQLPHAARDDDRAGRPLRRRQDHHRAPGAAADRSRRRARCTLDGVDLREVTPGLAAPRGGAGAAGRGPVQRHPLRQHRLRRSRTPARPEVWAAAEAAELADVHRGPAHKHGDPGRRARAEALRRRAPAGRPRPRAPGQPAPAGARRGHQRARRPAPRRRSRRRCARCAPAAPRWSSPTASRPSSTPTRSWSCAAAASSSAATTPTCWPRAANTPRCGGGRPRGRPR